MTSEELLNEQKREFVRLGLEVKRLKAAGNTLRRKRRKNA